MSSIMIDRWSLYNVITYLGGNIKGWGDYRLRKFYYYEDFYPKEIIDYCWDNFLTAVVLWDELWSFHQDNNYSWKKFFKGHNELINNLHDVIHQIEPSIIDESLIEIYNKLSTGQYDSHYLRGIDERTMGYRLISNSLGIPFLAHPSRRTYLSNRGEMELFTRLDLIQRIDKELIEYYNHINKELGRELLKFDYPVLIGYINSEATTPEEQLITALKLRKNSDVIIFREQMLEIEQVIARGDTQMILSQLKMVSDLAKEITNKYQQEIILGELEISLSPSISIPLKVTKNNKRNLHTTFIKKLIYFGIYERQQKYQV